jgi:hypothetical protein
MSRVVVPLQMCSLSKQNEGNVRNATQYDRRKLIVHESVVSIGRV